MPEATKITHEVPEYIKQERGVLWYAIAVLLGAALIVYAIMNGNFLFAVILVLAGVVMILMSLNEPRMIRLEIDPSGVRLGGKKYSYNQFREFSIIYQPPEINTLYLEFRLPLRERLSIPLGDIDPNVIRNYLLNFITEDLERDEESLTDILSRTLKF